ncbi:MAG: 16S rRNA (cytidine(1402)-2'-O)-methyltransferase, partial [Pseudomonadota bacterium]
MNPILHNLDPGLYLVATPLGRARDITLHSLDILASVDVIVAEDTRTARRLLDLHGIALKERPLRSYHDHSSAVDRGRIIALIQQGNSVAYMSEAGTPMIADPGFHLVKDVQNNGLAVTAAPGPCAAINALVLAGLPTDRFTFAGFLPPADDARKKALIDLLNTHTTLVIYETAKRLPAFLETLQSIVGGDHTVALCREMTKRFEQIIKDSISALRDYIVTTPPKGEIVLVVSAKSQTQKHDTITIDDALRKALLTMRVKDAADTVAGAFGLPRRDVYHLSVSRPVDKH